MPEKTKNSLLFLLSFEKIYQWGKCGPDAMVVGIDSNKGMSECSLISILVN